MTNSLVAALDLVSSVCYSYNFFTCYVERCRRVGGFNIFRSFAQGSKNEWLAGYLDSTNKQQIRYGKHNSLAAKGLSHSKQGNDEMRHACLLCDELLFVTAMIASNRCGIL